MSTAGLGSPLSPVLSPTVANRGDELSAVRLIQHSLDFTAILSGELEAEDAMIIVRMR